MSDASFYTVGGTVQAGGGLYIPRKADDELLQYCRQGQFAYVLTPRQMGKSSLMMRTAERLTSEGITPVVIDLTLIGQQVTAEQWYLGLLATIEDFLLLEEDAVGWWETHANLGLTQRLVKFCEDVLLKEIDGQIVIFIDEIDTTLGLDFTDDFFIAIRYLYNGRAHNPNLNRLSFVLIGVAAPSDLITDRHRTPFNIGRPVNLTDFTVEEARPLADGLGLSNREAWELLGWIHEWTQGHPYLTQRLCQAVTNRDRQVWTKEAVFQIVNRTFLGDMSVQDNNLQFVRDMLTKRAPDPLGVIKTYEAIRCKRRQTVPDEEQSIVKTHLKLAGVVRRSEGILKVRNPIYKAVFDCDWVKEHRPPRYWTREVQRAAVALIVVLFFIATGLAIVAYAQLLAAEDQAAIEAELRATAESAADLSVAAAATSEAAAAIEAESRRAAEENAIAMEFEVATRTAAQAAAEIAQANAAAAQEEAREQEANARQNLAGLLAAQSKNLLEDSPQQSLLLAVESVTMMQDRGNEPIALSYEALLEALTTVSGQGISGHTITDVAIASGYGKIITAGTDGAIRLWQADNLREMPRVLTGHQGRINALDLSYTNRYLASAGDDQTVRIWDLANLERPPQVLSNLDTGLTERNNDFTNVIFNPSLAGRDRLVTLDSVGIIQIWDLENPTQPATLTTPLALEFNQSIPSIPFSNLKFSSDGRWLAAEGADESIWLWDINLIESDTTQLPGIRLPVEEEENASFDFAFSPDGQWLSVLNAESDSDKEDALLFWRMADLEQEIEDGNPTFSVVQQGIAFNSTINISPDGCWLVMDTGGRSVRLFSFNELVAETSEQAPLTNCNSGLLAEERLIVVEEVVTVNEAGEQIITENEVVVEDDRSVTLEHPNANSIDLFAFSPDSSRLVTVDSNDVVYLWDITSSRETPLYEMVGHEATITNITISDNNQWLVTSSRDGTARLWNLNDPFGSAMPLTLPALEKAREIAVLQATYSPDGQQLLTIDWGEDSDDMIFGELRLWDTSNSSNIELSNSLPITDTDIPITAQYSKDGTLLAVLATNSGLFQGNGEDINLSTNLYVWQTNNLQAEPTIFSLTQNPVASTTIDPNNRWLAASFGDLSSFIVLILAESINSTNFEEPLPIFLWELNNSDSEPIILEGVEGLTGAPVISADGHWLISGSWNPDQIKIGNAQVWDLTAENIAGSNRLLPGVESSVLLTQFSPDDRWLITSVAMETGTTFQTLLHFWDMELPDPFLAPAKTIEVEDVIFSIAFSPDGRWLAADNPNESIVHLWDLTNLPTTLPLPDPLILDTNSDLLTLAFSPDSRWLAGQGLEERATILWNLSGDDPATSSFQLTNNSQDDFSTFVTALTFDPRDPNILVSGGNVWNLNLSEHIDLACQKAGRNLTLSEWEQQFVGQSYRIICPQNHVPTSALSALLDDIERLVTTDLADAEQLYSQIMASTLLSTDFDLASRACLTGQLNSLALSEQVCNHVFELAAIETDTSQIYNSCQTWHEAGLGDQAEPLCQRVVEMIEAEVMELIASNSSSSLASYCVDFEEVTTAQETINVCDLVVDMTIESENAELNNGLCWYGSINGMAESVLPACEFAVSVEPSNGNYYDSRGLARALIGDFEGAIADFEEFLEWAEQKEFEGFEIIQRQEWITALENEEDPFDQFTLEDLRFSSLKN